MYPKPIKIDEGRAVSLLVNHKLNYSQIYIFFYFTI